MDMIICPMILNYSSLRKHFRKTIIVINLRNKWKGLIKIRIKVLADYKNWFKNVNPLFKIFLFWKILSYGRERGREWDNWWKGNSNLWTSIHFINKNNSNLLYFISISSSQYLFRKIPTILNILKIILKKYFQHAIFLFIQVISCSWHIIHLYFLACKIFSLFPSQISLKFCEYKNLMMKLSC